jgi:phosphatidylserine/phosphatidylglycerophosphate/cardiolipin synthase-like enzyme
MVDSADHAALLASATPLTFVASDPDTIAAALRERIVGSNPLDFVAILIPRRLGEDPRFADGVLYEMRKRFITFLTHGLTDEQKRERLLIYHLRNRSGQFTYVHAKNMIVDDVWASIGSSNLGFRSMTYDGEINCDVIDGQIATSALRCGATTSGSGRPGGRSCSIRGADSRCCAPRRKAIWRGPTPWRRTIPRSLART